MSKGRIVIVEDETIVAKDIQGTLRNFGFEVPEIVSSGEEAIQAAFRLNPDLIMMDIMIKGAMDGIDAAEIIRSQFNIPVIYLTAYSDDETLRRAKLTESYGFIPKPFDERELLVAVEFALYKHQMNLKLAENQNWLAASLRSVPEAILVTDRDQKINLVTSQFEALLGWKEYEMKGLLLQDFFPFEVAKSRHDATESIELANRDGQKLKLTYTQTTARDEKGIAVGKVVVLKLNNG